MSQRNMRAQRSTTLKLTYASYPVIESCHSSSGHFCIPRYRAGAGRRADEVRSTPHEKPPALSAVGRILQDFTHPAWFCE